MSNPTRTGDELHGELEALRARVAELEWGEAERKRAAEALRESEERYRAIFEQAADSIVLIDTETGALIEFNDRAHQNLGYTREELKKLKISDFEAIESAEELAEHIQKVASEGSDTFETKHRTKQGQIRNILVSVRSISLGGRCFASAIWRDITERKRAGEALRKSEEAERRFGQRLTALHEVNNELTKADSVDELCRRAVELGRSRLGFDRLGIWFFGGDGVSLEGSFGIDEKGQIRDERGRCIPTTPSGMDRLRSRRPADVTREEDIQLCDDAGQSIGSGTQAWTSIWDGQKNIGFLNMDNLLEQRPIIEHDCELLTLYASALGHLCARKRVEQTLRDSRDYLDRALNGMHEGVMVVDRDLTIRDTNECFLRQHKSTREQIVGRRCYEVTHRVDRPCWGAAHDCPAKKVFDTGEPLQTEHIHVGHAGNELVAEIHAFPLFGEDGNVEYVVELSHDITEHKRAEESLRESEEAERRFRERLTALHEVNNELTRADSVDELCRRAVELGRSRLGFDRLGIWFLSEDALSIQGSFGIDENGQIRDERGRHFPTTGKGREILASRKRTGVIREESIELSDDKKQPVGTGAVIWTPIWDGQQTIGSLSVDNLLEHRPISDHDCEVLALYASAFGHLYVRKQAHEALRESEDRLRRVVQALPIILYSAEGGTNRLLLLMGAVRGILGYDPQELRDNPDFLIQQVHPEDREYVRRTFTEGLESRKPFELEYRFVHRTECRQVWLHERVVPLVGPDGTILRQDGVVLDVSERRRAEEEREQMQAQLLQAQKLESIGVLAGGIAHDFNNVLTIISGNAQLLLTSLSLDPDQAMMLKDIRAAATQVAEMTRALQAFSRPTKPQIRCGDANRHVQEVYRLLRRMLPATIEFRLDLAPSPCTAAVDPGQMQQVLVNLCVNARDAMPTGGALEIRTRRVGPESLPSHAEDRTAPDGYVQIRVSDTGCGMDADMLQRVFDPFFTTKPKDRGTGLGLSVVYRIVQAHNGVIDLASEPGKGTNVDIFFPAARAPVFEAEEHEIPSARGLERILVVVDEEMIANLLKTLLEDRGYHVSVAREAGEAIELVRSSDRPFDLAIVDCPIPNVTGDVCLAAIRRTHPELKAILIAASDADESEVTANDCHVVHKPFTVPSIARTVREVLDK